MSLLCPACRDVLHKMIQAPLTTHQTTVTNLTQLDSKDLLDRFHISPRTLQNWRSKGYLPYTRIGRKMYYNESDVQQMLATYRKGGLVRVGGNAR